MRATALLVVGLAAVAGAAEPRFFVAGDGSLAIANRATGERVDLRYRDSEGRYDYGALDRIRRVLRSRDGLEGEVTPRFVELLSWMYVRAGQPLVLLSGYRSPVYNEGIRRRGVRAAGGSLHTEGLAADLALRRDLLEPLWLELRALDCCGAGHYARQGFLHVDVGKPRFWEADSSRTDENLSGGNARAFARTDYDRYAAGEMLLVRLHGITAPPVRLQRAALLVPDAGRSGTLAVEEVGAPPGDGCITADGATRLLVKGAPPTSRGRIVFTTCEPRAERTPDRIESNPVSLR
jgi:uncharacterized protein YcbK (DUF882 family)